MEIMCEEDGDPVLFRFRGIGHTCHGEHEQGYRQGDGNDDGDDADDFLLLQERHLRILKIATKLLCEVYIIYVENLVETVYKSGISWGFDKLRQNYGQKIMLFFRGIDPVGRGVGLDLFPALVAQYMLLSLIHI